MMDRHPGYDTSNDNWCDTRICKALCDPDPNVIRSKLLLEPGELNMGVPKTLVFFVNFTVSKFPAKHYALVLWDHGDAWRSGFPVKGVCWDETNGWDYLTGRELIEALTNISKMDVHLDIIGFDVYLLQMFEIAYDIGKYGFADIMVASGEFEPWDGWYYAPFLQKLITNPDMSAEELAANIVEAYAYFYTNVVKLDFPTLSAVDLRLLATNATQLLNSLARLLTINVFLHPETVRVIKALRDKSEKFGMGEFIDLYDFVSKIASYQTWSEAWDPRQVATQLLEVLNKTIIACWAASGHPNAHGTAIYFPPNVDWYLEGRFWYFGQTGFAIETWWSIFLDYFFKAFTPAKQFKVEVTTSPLVVRGSKSYALIQVVYGGKKVDPDALVAKLVPPNGTNISLKVSMLGNIHGVFMAEIPALIDVNGAFIVVGAYYWFLARTASTSFTIADNITDYVIRNCAEVGSLIKTVGEEIKGTVSDQCRPGDQGCRSQ